MILLTCLILRKRHGPFSASDKVTSVFAPDIGHQISARQQMMRKNSPLVATIGCP